LIIPRANAGIHGVGYAEKGLCPAAGTPLRILAARALHSTSWNCYFSMRNSQPEI
jgi:hypothetical protein